MCGDVLQEFKVSGINHRSQDMQVSMRKSALIWIYTVIYCICLQLVALRCFLTLETGDVRFNCLAVLIGLRLNPSF